MNSLQSKFLFLTSLLLIVKICFFVLVYIITRQIQKRARALKESRLKQMKASSKPT